MVLRVRLIIFALLYAVGALSEPLLAEYCLAENECGNLEAGDELGRWDCVGRHLYAALPSDDKQKHATDHAYFVEHDCGGVGWGNSIRGLYNAAGIATTIGRRLIVTHSSFNRVFLPPNDSVAAWDFGTSLPHPSSSKQQQHENVHARAWALREYFKYEEHGRAPGRFETWIDSLRSGADVVYKKPIMTAGICGGERELLTTGGGCLSRLFPDFLSCATSPSQTAETYLPENMLAIPFFYTLFRRPAPILGEVMDLIRSRVGLDPLPAGTEDANGGSGSWGLRTPGHYILALHFRRVPIGFEPLALELNEDRNKQYRLNTLKGFWAYSERAVRRAKTIADCRGEKLLVYFATDDVKSLRPEAERRLGSLGGRIVFGLTEDEVGHMSPQWTQQEVSKLSKVKKSVEKGLEAAGEGEKANAGLIEVEVDTHMHGKTVLKIDPAQDKIASPSRTQDSTSKHGVMAIVEWWVLAQSHWLVGHSGTSFSETASGVGLGPLGVMERFSMVHGPDHASESFRRDWGAPGGSCRVVGAADKEHASTCPNTAS